MDYKRYATEISDFQAISLSSDEVTFLFRLVNTGLAPKISSYFRLRSQSAGSKSDRFTANRLLKMNLIQEGDSRFLSGSANYRLSEKGIFCILSRVGEYPPALLTKYNDSTVLQALIYQFFEVQTIKRCTARLYRELIRYLKECTSLTISKSDGLKKSSSEGQSNERIQELEMDLMMEAKVFVLRLAMMYSEANILRCTSEMEKDSTKVALYELENDMKRLLIKDSRFRSFLSLSHDEMVEGFNEIQKKYNQIE